MLILAKITTSSAGGYAQYLEGKAQASALGDYYLKDGERTEAPGRWAGGSRLFGLDPDHPVTGKQLHTLMDVRRPDTGQPLRRAGGSGEAVAAIDATFSAPKSVSAVWALAGPDLRAQTERAHETAIDRALDYATRQVAMLRRRVSSDTVIHEKASGLVATSWRHSTARAVDEQVPDPQLHSHVLLHGAVRRDGRVVAIDSRSWLVHQREVGAAYRTELARELQQLGFAITRGTGRGGRYFELDAVPQPLVDRWSSRHHQVQAAVRQRLSDQARALEATIAQGGTAAVDVAAQLRLLRATGRLSPAQERMMGTTTRGAKIPVTVADLDSEWQQTARGLGVSREGIEPVRDLSAVIVMPAGPREVLDGLTEFEATFPARDARAVALERSAGAPIHAALEQLRGLRASQEILVLADGTGTTRQHRGRERTVVAIAQRLATDRLTPLPATMAKRETDRLDTELAITGGRLSAEQRAAIALGCGSRPLVLIKGQAGTGKSTTLTGIARAHQACGQQILVTSTAALAAERLATELTDHGVRCDAFSTAALHAAITHDRVRLTAQTTIIHDEAALASTREQLDLLDAVKTAGARLIAVGDPQQNQPVGASGLWDHIEQATRLADAHVELTHNQRAHDHADRRDQALFRTGHAEQAIRGYGARDRVHLDHDPRRAEDQALDAAHADRTRGKTTTVIAQTSNQHLDQLNARAQAIRHQAGQLGEPSTPIPGRPYRLHPGDHVQIRHSITHSDHGTLRNGTTAQITAVDPDTHTLALGLGDGALALTKQQTADADLRLAYVQHPFPAQGQTTDTTHLIIAEHATQEGSYVGLTRARQTTDIYANHVQQPPQDGDRLHALAGRMSRTEPDLPSIHTPLAHETAITTHASAEDKLPSRRPTLSHEPPADDPSEQQRRTTSAHLTMQTNDPSATREQHAPETHHLDPQPALVHDPVHQTKVNGPEEAGATQPTTRRWPRARPPEPLTPTDDKTPEHDHSLGLEP